MTIQQTYLFEDIEVFDDYRAERCANLPIVTGRCNGRRYDLVMPEREEDMKSSERSDLVALFRRRVIDRLNEPLASTA